MRGERRGEGGRRELTGCSSSSTPHCHSAHHDVRVAPLDAPEGVPDGMHPACASCGGGMVGSTQAPPGRQQDQGFKKP